MARLIRTEKEVEGRYEEVWLVVEEDPLDQWPPGPREVGDRSRLQEVRRGGTRTPTAEPHTPRCLFGLKEKMRGGDCDVQGAKSGG